MNTDDLRQTLQTIAADVDPVDDADRLDAVGRRVIRTRHRRVGAGVGCAAVVAALAVAVPSLVGTGDEGRDPSAGRTHHGSVLPTVEDRGTRFYTSPAGDTLIGEAVARTGSRSVSLRVVPTTSDLSYRAVCWQPNQSSGQRLIENVFVNGHLIRGASCDGPAYGPLGPDSSFGTGSSHANSAGWRDVGVVPGKAMTVRVSLRPRVPASIARSTQLGVGLYANTGPRGHDHGVWYQQQVVVGGHTYQLVRRGFREVTGVRGRLSVDLPTAAQPLYLVYGAAHAHSGYRLTGDTSGAASQTAAASDYGELGRRGQRTTHVEIRLHRQPGALLYILAYRRLG